MTNPSDPLLDFPWDLWSYEQFIAAATPPASGDYLFAERAVRFEPRPADRLECPPDLRVVADGAGVRLEAPTLGLGVFVPDVSAALAARAVELVKGRAAALELGFHGEELAAFVPRFLRATFGVMVFAPAVLRDLQARAPYQHLVRFPSSPYQVDRSYWENQADLRDEVTAFLAAGSWPADEEWDLFLRRCHLTALLGRDRQSFYRPASPVARREVFPGRFHEVRPSFDAAAEQFYAGLRVDALAVGGGPYLELVRRSLPAEEVARRPEIDGCDPCWGQLARLRAKGDAGAKLWFVPPRPQEGRRRAWLRQRLRAAAELLPQAPVRSDSWRRGMDELAAFHQGWVRLHPFYCGNQAVGMALVNAVLAAAGQGAIPHLLMDHFALRFSAPEYAALFERAVLRYGGRELGEVQLRCARWFDWLGRLQGQEEMAAAVQHALREPEAARDGLVEPGAFA